MVPVSLDVNDSIIMLKHPRTQQDHLLESIFVYESQLSKAYFFHVRVADWASVHFMIGIAVEADIRDIRAFFL